MTGLIEQLPSLGIAGLLFVMWWYERAERLRSVQVHHDACGACDRSSQMNTHLLDVIQQNTEALVSLREALHTHRLQEADWVARLTQQLERLEAA
jgi:hypothetical protein